MPSLKTVAMVLALAAVTGASTACFGLFTRDDDAAPALAESCEGLAGQARLDCERRKAAER
jgi:uncharacterized membrane protein